ncbi:MAG: Asp-tRNA(Asn)/Glu-tRNA(Gln) amidotransferase subunit GatA [Candidatus Marinimicrobia bacterium]|nr:Asp-tRNA(Asn)/Glu-tRNA(Gln) amidotransferase subunit GatA [Candidatus Neomarinimicrobiota bacterium]
MLGVRVEHNQYLKKVDDSLSLVEEMSDLNIFISLDREAIRKSAEEISAKMQKGDTGPLSGKTVAIKDAICTKNIPTTCGSQILKNFVPPYDATVVEKIKSSGGLIFGKTNMDEFAMGSSTENSSFGPVKNPHNKAKVPGGSSGGSTSAVAAGIVDMALGSDTGGSIRLPASFCGVVGMKPTYGRVSRYGLVAFASSLDQIGPIASNVRDCAELLTVISGSDECDSTSSDKPVDDYASLLESDVKGLKIGLPEEYYGEGCDPEVLESVMDVVNKLKSLGASVQDVSLPHTGYAIAAYYIIATAEASSNLERYDGMRYGIRGEGNDLSEVYESSRSMGFGDEVKRRIMLGTYVLSAGYYDAYYKKAQQVRRLIRDDFLNAFEKIDVLITPTAPTTAFNLGEKIENPLSMYLVDIYTTSLNLAGLPGISVPCGKSSEGMPIGVQISGKPFAESEILSVAARIEEYVSP